jgi:hypothetical protein
MTTEAKGNTAGEINNLNGDGWMWMWMQQEQDDRVCNYASKGKERTPSLLCLSQPLDRKRRRTAIADRFFRLVSTPNQRKFAHNVVSITSPSVRDHHPQIGKLEIGMCSGLQGESEGEIKWDDAQAMRTSPSFRSRCRLTLTRALLHSLHDFSRHN